LKSRKKILETGIKPNIKEIKKNTKYNSQNNLILKDRIEKKINKKRKRKLRWV